MLPAFSRLPDVNNMCRIRALEARTRSSAGEKVVAGRPGGFNLGFEIEVLCLKAVF